MPRRWLGARAAGGAKFKYHYSVLVDEVVLRAGVVAPPDASFRIAWKRGDKLATTRARAAEGGRIKFDETLALVCTMYRDTTGGGFDAKEATFTLLQQQGHKGETRKMARVSLDLSSYASVDPVVKDCGLVLLHDGVPVGDAKLTISCRWLRNYSRDRRAQRVGMPRRAPCRVDRQGAFARIGATTPSRWCRAPARTGRTLAPRTMAEAPAAAPPALRSAPPPPPSTSH